MIVTDPIADMLTRIRNALTIRRDEVVVPASKTKNAIAEILFNQGYIEKYELVDDSNYKSIKITLKYGPNGEKVIQGFCYFYCSISRFRFLHIVHELYYNLYIQIFGHNTRSSNNFRIPQNRFKTKIVYRSNVRK